MNDMKNKIIDDVTRVLSGVGGAASAMRDEIENLVGAKVDQLIAERGLVTRDEFELLRAQVELLQEQLAKND